MLRLTSLLGLIFLSAGVLAQDVHPEVQAALDWQLPENKCEFKLKPSRVESDMERKYKKAMKKFKKCTGKYTTGLAEEQQKMMAVAHHGLTQAQADIIMGHMLNIKKVTQMIDSFAERAPDVPVVQSEDYQGIEY